MSSASGAADCFPSLFLSLLTGHDTRAAADVAVLKDALVVVANDTASGDRVVLTNLANAIGIFTAQILDPTQMEPLFVAALVSRLAKKFAPALAEMKLNAEKMEAIEAAQSGADAEAHDG